MVNEASKKGLKSFLFIFILYYIIFIYYIYILIESNMISVHTHIKRSGIFFYGRLVAGLTSIKLYLHLYLQCFLNTHTHIL